MTYTYNAHKGGSERGDGPMTVRALIEHLSQMNPNALVVLSMDGRPDHIAPVVSLNSTFYQDGRAKVAKLGGTGTPFRWDGDPKFQGWLNNAPDPGTLHAVCLWPQEDEPEGGA